MPSSQCCGFFMFAWEERSLEEKCTNRLPDQLWKRGEENNVLVQRHRIWWNHCSSNSKCIPLSLSPSLRLLWHRCLIFYVGHSEERNLLLTHYKPMGYNHKREAKQKKNYKDIFGSFSHIFSLYDIKTYWHAPENLGAVNFPSKCRGRKNYRT